jgi:membrane protein
LFLLNFGSYNKTLGSLAAAVVFLIWLWISNAAVILGVELDAQLSREHGAGQVGRLKNSR